MGLTPPEGFGRVACGTLLQSFASNAPQWTSRALKNGAV